jgi:hypothetical protein
LTALGDVADNGSERRAAHLSPRSVVGRKRMIAGLRTRLGNCPMVAKK